MINIKINKFYILTINSLLLSPIASIPFLVLQLRKKAAIIDMLVSIIMGFFSLRYIPSFSNDKVRYIECSDLSVSYSLNNLLLYFKVVNIILAQTLLGLIMMAASKRNSLT